MWKTSRFDSSAIYNNSTDLKEYCFEFMSENMKSIYKAKEYQQMNAKKHESFLTKLHSN